MATDGLVNLEKLNYGLLALSLEREAQDLAYKAMGTQTKDHAFIDRKNEYVRDLQRVLREAHLTTHLMKTAKTAINIEKMTFYEEDIVKYYEGIFLDQVHQAKDKLFQLIRLFLIEKTPKNPRIEENIKVSRFLNNNEKILNKIDIYETLKPWIEDQSNKTSMGVDLRKRTQHHHRVSLLGYDMNFQRTKMSRTMLAPDNLIRLSDFGKTKLADIGKEAYEEWRGKVVRKQEESLKEIEKCVNFVCGKLINYYSIPTNPTKLSLSAQAVIESEKKFEVVNTTSLDKIHNDVKKIIKSSIKPLKTLGGIIESVYLVGSAARQDFIPGVSNATFIFITKGKLDISSSIPIPVAEVKILSKEEFNSEAYKKVRFYCYSDGLLILGKEQIFDKKEFPKPGTLLAILLNSDYESELEDIRSKVAKLDQEKDGIKLFIYSKQLARIMIHFLYGVAISNNPSYTPKMLDKILLIREEFPQYAKMINLLDQIYTKRALDKDSFPLLIDAFYTHARRNFTKMLKNLEGISNRKSI